MNIISQKINGLVRRYRKLKVQLALRVNNDIPEEEVKNPTFLLGTNSGGLTLISSIIHRHPQVVYVTGNYKKWAGEDETYNILADSMPNKLKARKIPSFPLTSVKYGKRKQPGLYAIDQALPFNRMKAEDFDTDTKYRLEKIIKTIARVNKDESSLEPLRYVDKSQIFTVKVGLINKLLKEYKPKFVLISRNPFAFCKRELQTLPDEYEDNLPDHEWIKLFAQQWENSFNSALEDESNASLKFFRFEDILKNPKEKIRQLFQFINLDFQERVLPQKEDEIPLGSEHHVFTHKWFPLRPEVNKKHLNKLTKPEIEIIESECGDLADKFNYTPEGP